MSYAKINYPELTLIQDKEYILNIYLNYLKQLKTVKKKTIHYINIIIPYSKVCLHLLGVTCVRCVNGFILTVS